MKRYTNALGAVSPSAAGAKRVADIVAALAPPPGPGTAVAKTTAAPEHHESLSTAAVKMVPGLAGGAIGWMMFKRTHPVLGFLGGHAVGSAAYSLYKGGEERKRALCQLGVEAAGIGGALMWKRHPVLGWVAGVVAGTAASSMITGSPAHEELGDIKDWLKKKLGR